MTTTFTPPSLELKIENENWDWIYDPRKEYDHLGIMVCWHTRADLGDETIRSDDYDHEVLDDLVEDYSDGEAIAWLPVFLYEHSGMTVNTSGFSCPWDSGMVGFIYTTKQKLVEAGHNRDKLPKTEDIEEWLRGEVVEYDQYLTGDIWVVQVEDKDSGEIVESFGGIYGYENAKEEGESLLESAQREYTAEQRRKFYSRGLPGPMKVSA